MKLVIQIPCYNESKTLENTISSIPDKVSGIDEVEVLVIDDGSTDSTAEIARKLGVNVIAHKTNKGLAQAFQTGLTESLKLGADIIVNLDADNQYCARDIEKVIAPILSCNADMVIGVRPIIKNDEFSLFKKIFSILGSLVVRVLSKTNVVDAVSGFRAFSKNAAAKFKIEEKYTYTIETIFQAKIMRLKIANIKIRVNPKTRKSKLVKSIPNYIYLQAKCILKNYFKYYYIEFISFLFIVLFIIFIFK